jgi:hypothetical protein
LNTADPTTPASTSQTEPYPKGSHLSPFTTALHIQALYFNMDEIKQLFKLFTADNGIQIDEAVLNDILAKSNGCQLA